MQSKRVFLWGSEALELAGDISDGVWAARANRIPSPEWIRDMAIWAVLLMNRLDDEQANPGCEER